MAAKLPDKKDLGGFTPRGAARGGSGRDGPAGIPRESQRGPLRGLPLHPGLLPVGQDFAGMLLGCSTAAEHRRAVQADDGGRLSAGQVQREIRLGMTNAEVVQALGSPNMVATDEQRREVWVYRPHRRRARLLRHFGRGHGPHPGRVHRQCRRRRAAPQFLQQRRGVIQQPAHADRDHQVHRGPPGAGFRLPAVQLLKWGGCAPSSRGYSTRRIRTRPCER